MRSIGRELPPFLAVLAITAAILSVLPYKAAWFRAGRRPTPTPAAAFVTLSPEEEMAAMRAAKTSWQGDADSSLRMRADLSFGELPAAKEDSVLDVGERTRPAVFRGVGWAPPPFLPSRAAPPLRQLPPQEAQGENPAFTRDELLSLGSFE